MAFEKQAQITRNPHIRNLEIKLYRTIEQDDPKYPEVVEFILVIDDQWDRPMGNRNGDLVPHLTQTQITALQSFVDAMWAKAEAEVIG